MSDTTAESLPGGLSDQTASLLETFRVVATLGKISLAARALFLSQPAVTAQIGQVIADMMDSGAVAPVVGARFPLDLLAQGKHHTAGRGARAASSILRVVVRLHSCKSL